MSRIIKIFDTTLRDGEQSPGCSMNIEEKLMVARQLARMKVDIIEAGFPVASEGDFEAVRRIAQEIKGPVICGLARTTDKDIDRAAEAIKPAGRGRIHTFLATSDIHLKFKLKKTREQVLEMAIAAVKRARNYTDDVEFSARGRDTLGHRLSLQGGGGGDCGGRGHGEYPRYRGLCDTA